MSVLVDTSALYALLDEDDANHRSARSAWSRLLDTEVLFTHSYVVVESSALVQRRLGMAAAVQLHRDLLPALDLVAIDANTHARSVDRWLATGRRTVSLVDVTSFVIMQDRQLTGAFCFDSDFVDAGFSAIP